MSIQNLASYDPFADVGDDPAPEDIVEEKKKTSQANSYVHIRICLLYTSDAADE